MKPVLENIRCNFCNQDNFTIIYPPRYDLEKDKDLSVKFRSSGDETLIDQVVKCKHCNLVYVNPRLKSEEIVKGYSEGTDELFVSQAKGRELTFRKSLKLINHFSPNKGRILDVGTAGGSFLYVAKQDGWKVEGCELNKWMTKWAKENYGIDITAGTIFEAKYPEKHFDVVTLWDVLEHVPDPKVILKECNRILKDDGLLIVNYPDYGSWLAKLMGRKWIFLLSVHLFYFTPKTIRTMLTSTSFKIIKTKPHFQRLALGYLIFRMKAYSPFLHKVGGKVVNVLRLGDLQIPYWLGQTLVIARKIQGESK